MKKPILTSVVVIAHNEENNINRCLDNLFYQTVYPGEIIVICHNCTDKTYEIANMRKSSKHTEVKVIDYHGPHGIVRARLEGLRHVSGEIVLCIDGDSFPDSNWVEIMVRTLKHNDNFLVGSRVKFKGMLIGYLFNEINYFLCKSGPAYQWIWGPSMAFFAKDKDLIAKLLLESLNCARQLDLPRNPEDLFLAYSLFMEGKQLEVTRETFVVQQRKESNSIELIKRSRSDVANMNHIIKHFNDYKFL